MTIRFDHECDMYLDSEDKHFQVSMNEEDDMPEFKNQTDFWCWYYDVERALKVDINESKQVILPALFECDDYEKVVSVIVLKDYSDLWQSIENKIIKLNQDHKEVFFKRFIYEDE